MLRNAWRIRAWGACPSVLVAGSMPCIPATKTKSPALVPRLQVPSALMAPGGLSVFTPLGEGDCAEPGPDTSTAAVTPRKASRCNILFLAGGRRVGGMEVVHGFHDHDFLGRGIDAQFGEAVAAVALAALRIDDHGHAIDLQRRGVADRVHALALAAELDGDVLLDL